MHTVLSRQQRLRTTRRRGGPLVVEELESRVVPALPRPDHVVVVVEENHAYGQVIGAAEAPYINALARQGALLTASYAIEHPSQPNYLDLFSGANQGVHDSLRPAGLPFTTPNLGAALRAAGLSFVGYSESLPFAGFDGDSFTTIPGQFQYERRHNPWANFTNNTPGVNQLPPSVNQPFTSFPADFANLPTVAFVVPNLQNDMHDGTVLQADRWLQTNLDGYVQWARTHNSLLVVTWDEDDHSEGNHIPTIFVGPMVQPGTYAQVVNHFDVLRTLEDMYGLPAAGASAAATPLTAIWAQLQFSAAVLSVPEGGVATVTVTRGNSQGTASAQFVVGVPGGLALKNQATPGVDFQGPLSGTLTFNAGETQRALSFLLPADNLVEAAESFTVTLLNPTGSATLGAQATITVSIADGNLPAVPNATPNLATLQAAGSGFGKSTEHYLDFVNKAYARFLNRQPDAEGLQHWVSLMQLYETSGHTRGLRQEQIEAGFLDSPEYLSRNTTSGRPDAEWVNSIYVNLLNRTPDANGRASWLAQLTAGVSATAVALGFTTSLERLRNRVTDTYFTLLGRAPDTAGLNNWVGVFQAGGTTEDINSGFVGSLEYYLKPDGAAGNPARWLREAYLDILFRPARTDELGNWLSFLGR